MNQSINNLQQKKQPFSKGSFLADVLVSLFILMSSLGIGYSVINNALIAHAINKNKIIAVNLAQEGMEAVRLIRDTNWLQYGTKKRVCWNFWNNTNEDSTINSTDDTCLENGTSGQNNHPIGVSKDTTRIKNYIAVLDEINYNWLLVENFYQIQDAPKENMNNNIKTCNYAALSKKLTTDNNCDPAGTWKIRKDNAEPTKVSSRLYIDKTTGLYTHNKTNSSGFSNTPTNFYREIYIEYPANTTSGEEGFYPSEKYKDNQMMITVKVWYPRNNGYYSLIVMETELTDYYGRTDWLD